MKNLLSIIISTLIITGIFAAINVMSKLHFWLLIIEQIPNLVE
jgi:hypothetical protein